MILISDIPFNDVMLDSNLAPQFIRVLTLAMFIPLYC